MNQVLTLFWIIILTQRFLTDVFAGLLEDQRRQRNIQEQKYLQVYGSVESGYHETIRRGESDVRYRQSVYFSPQGINVNRFSELNRAIQTDFIKRETKFNSLQTEIQDKSKNFINRYNVEYNSVVDEQGQLKTYNKDRITESSNNLKQLGEDVKEFQSRMQGDIAETARNTLTIPYFDRLYEKEGPKSANQFVQNVLEGNDKRGGLSSLQSTFFAQSYAFQTVSDQIRKAEDSMRDNLLSSSIGGAIQIAAGAVLSVASPLAGVPMLLSGASQLGYGVRNHVVLNSQGLDAFQSDAESSAALGINSFQQAMSALQALSSMKGSFSSIRQASQNGTKFSNGEKLYIGYQFINSGFSVGGISGLNKKLLNEDGENYIRAGLSAIDLAFLGSGVTSSVNLKLNPILNKMRGDSTLKEASHILNKQHPVSLTSHVMSKIVTVSQAIPEIKKTVELNQKYFQWGFYAIQLAELSASKTFNERQMIKAGRTVPEKYAREKFSKAVGDEENYDSFGNAILHSKYSKKYSAGKKGKNGEEFILNISAAQIMTSDESQLVKSQALIHALSKELGLFRNSTVKENNKDRSGIGLIGLYSSLLKKKQGDDVTILHVTPQTNEDAKSINFYVKTHSYEELKNIDFERDKSKFGIVNAISINKDKFGKVRVNGEEIASFSNGQWDMQLNNLGYQLDHRPLMNYEIPESNSLDLSFPMKRYWE